MTIGPGTVLDGRYLVEDELGGGAFGTVWRCQDSVLKRDVAIKVLHLRDSPESLERFRREGFILARLSHPGITTVYDIGSHEGQPFIVMELLKGDDLGKILTRNPSGLPVGTTLDLTIQTAKALAAAHESGVVHRDLKPSNLLVLPGNRMKICDFGISKAIDVTRTLTEPGHFIGTPAYMSPEQFAGVANSRSDLYSLGCVLYAMLTGHSPFYGDIWQVLAHQHANVSPEPPRGVETIPESLSALVLRLLAKRPQDRPATASAVSEELQEISLAPGRPPRPVPRQPTTQTAMPYAANLEPQAAQPSVDPAKARKDAARLANELAEDAAAELEAMSPQQAVLTISHFRSPALLRNVLDRMKPAAAAALLEHMPSRKSTVLLTKMGREQAVRIMDAMSSALAATTLEHMTPSTTERMLTGMEPGRAAAALTAMMPGDAASRLGRTGDDRIAAILTVMEPKSAIALLAAMPEYQRHRVTYPESSLGNLLPEANARYDDRAHRLAPWKVGFITSGFLLAATAVALVFGAAENWESWPWIFVLIPVGILGSVGAGAGIGTIYQRPTEPVIGIVAYLASAILSVLLVTSWPHVLIAPASVIAALLGTAQADLIDAFEAVRDVVDL